MAVEKKQPKLKSRYKRLYDKFTTKANKLLTNKKKISNCIKKARKIFERLHNLPRFDAFSNNICNFCDLLSDYFDGTYKNLPLSTIVAILAGLLYLILPIDCLADFIPILGWIDDAAVLGFVVVAEQNDVREYLAWKANETANQLTNK